MNNNNSQQEELEQDFTKLQGLVLKGLVQKLSSKDANSTDYSNAIKFLRDNNIIKEEVPKSSSAYLADIQLPFVDGKPNPDFDESAHLSRPFARKDSKEDE